MIKVMVQAVAGSRERRVYDEKTLAFRETRVAPLVYPFPYGFILETSGPDDDNLDCYIMTEEKLIAGSIVECEPAALLPFEEGAEPDHKILAKLPGQDGAIDQEKLEALRTFISGVFAYYPETTIKIGDILPATAAERFIREHRVS